jgi:hypothetical protein
LHEIGGHRTLARFPSLRVQADELVERVRCQRGNDELNGAWIAAEPRHDIVASRGRNLVFAFVASKEVLEKSQPGLRVKAWHTQHLVRVNGTPHKTIGQQQQTPWPSVSVGDSA